jgi:hypothetical protein
LAKLLGMPYFPISPFLPVLGPASYFPLPVKFHVHLGEPLRFEGPYDDEDQAIDDKVKVVSGAIQQLIDRGLAERRSIF